MQTDIRRARVAPELDTSHQQHALAIEGAAAHAPQDFCHHVGLNWMTALELFEKEILSFDPRRVDRLSRSQEAELSFLGRLTAAGCCGSQLRMLLNGLEKPYAYNLDRMYYDWTSRHWRLLEDVEHIEGRLEEWLQELTDWGDVDVLERIRSSVDEALLESHARQRAADRRPRAAMSLRSGGERL